MKYTAIINYSPKAYLSIAGNFIPGYPGTRLDPPEESEFEIEEVFFVRKDSGVRFNLEDLPEALLAEQTLSQYYTNAHDMAENAYYKNREQEPEYD